MADDFNNGDVDNANTVNDTTDPDVATIDICSWSTDFGAYVVRDDSDSAISVNVTNA